MPRALTVAPPLGIVREKLEPELYPVAGESQVPGVLAVGVPPSVRTQIVAPDVESETVMWFMPQPVSPEALAAFQRPELQLFSILLLRSPARLASLAPTESKFDHKIQQQ